MISAVKKTNINIGNKPELIAKLLGLAAVLALIAGGCLRLRGIVGDLWLDEIWSLNNLKSVSSFFDIFTSLKTDNNHFLNSAYLYIVGDAAGPIIYRFPALIFSIGVMLLAPGLSFHRGKRETQFSIILISLSFPIVLFTTEARGYAGMLFFAVVALLNLHSNAQKPDINKIYYYWGASIISFLFHFGFVHLFVGLVLWSLIRILKSDARRAWVRELFVTHSVPALFIAFVYFTYIINLPEGSGPLRSYIDVVLNTASVMIGQAELSAWNTETSSILALVALVFIIILVVEIIKRFFEGDETWAIYFGAVFLAPALFLWVAEPRVIFIRYFLISLFMSYFLLAGFLDRIWSLGSGGIAVALFLLLSFIYGHASYFSDFWKYDRGSNVELVEFLRDQTTSDKVTITGYQGFRDQIILDYYSEYFAPKKYIYFESDQSRADWYLHQSQDRFENPQEYINLNNGKRYKFVKEFPFTAISGWRWWVYFANENSQKDHSSIGN